MYPATIADVDWLHELHTGRVAEYLCDLPPNEREALVTVQTRARHNPLNWPSTQERVIRRGDERIGRVLLDLGERHWHLVDITLLPRYRRTGRGTRVLRKLLAEAAAAGCEVQLEVRLDNPARRLYSRLGFQAVASDGTYLSMTWSPTAKRDPPRTGPAGVAHAAAGAPGPVHTT
jgi:ribosomal protein S18 acetylase RimI-like enzyme